MKILANILLIILILNSCTEKHNQTNSYYLTEDALIYQLFDSLIMPDSIYRKDFPKSKSKKQGDGLSHKRDTVQLYLAIDDTLINFSKSIFSEHLREVKDYFKYNIKNIDSSYHQLFDRLINDPMLIERKINIKGFHTNYNYVLIPSDSVKLLGKMGCRIISTYQFSRIVFNDKFDKACFYKQSICGGECGGGSLVFLEKKKGIWKIVKQIGIWVS